MKLRRVRLAAAAGVNAWQLELAETGGEHEFTFLEVADLSTLYGVTLDCYSVVEITAADYGAAREIMFENFGRKWSMQYTEASMKMEYFPRGVVLRLPRR